MALRLPAFRRTMALSRCSSSLGIRPATLRPLSTTALLHKTDANTPHSSTILLEDEKTGFGFIRHNARSPKPRKVGVTEIRGPYYSAMGRRYLQDVLETMGYFIDGLKFAGGSFSLFPEERLRELIDLAHEHGVYVSTGGWAEHILLQSSPSTAIDQYLAKCKSLGFDVVEISAGFLSIPNDDFVRLVERVQAQGLKAKPELGIQFGAGGDTDPATLEAMAGGTSGGAGGGRSPASKIVELGRRFIEQCGVERIMVESEGITENVGDRWRTEVVRAVLAGLPPEKVMFEAAEPRVFNWYVREFGADVNLFVDHSQIGRVERWVFAQQFAYQQKSS
ncbi:hypothetical protein VTJ83DRAFT_7532 [Remersonia thermophila]|uniref:Sulfonate biosynthesis enzyme n=1 Tax=Remersonia thermophila TaxID=72144 RepID=A0ABR4D642_9PEZI